VNKLYHIGLDNNIGARYAILPGDPGRVKSIAEHLDDSKIIAHNREFTTYCGTLCGEKVLVTSTGIGGPSAAIAVEELYKAGVRTFIRVGTCGAMQPHIKGGDIIIAAGAVRAEGTSKEYAPIEYPAIADFTATSALLNAAEKNGYSSHLGVVQSKDSFYGQHCPNRMPTSYELENKWNAWIHSGCLASEMECAAIFIVSSILRAQSGAVLSVLWNQETEKGSKLSSMPQNTGNAIKTAVEAVKILIKSSQTP